MDSDIINTLVFQKAAEQSHLTMTTINKLLLAGLCWAVGLSARAQGTVNINNNFTAPGASSKAFVVVVEPPPPLPYRWYPVPKALGRIEVLDSTGALISSVKDGTGNAFGADGLFFLGVTAIPGTVPGGAGTIFIRAWDSSTGSTYPTATTKSITMVTLVGLGGGLTPTPSLGVAGNFTGLDLYTIIPEPSKVVLAALGVFGLVFVTRRK